jgi:peroxiredoxin
MASDTGLALGDQAPNFTGPLVTPDGDGEDVSLSELLDDRPVLLCFYTNDFSPDCIDQWCSFRDYDWFTANDNVQVVGVSKSRPTTHRKFIDYLDLNFPLFADTDLEIAAAFDVDYRVFKVAPRSRRSCFLLDQDGVVRYRWISEHPLDPTRDTPPVGDIQAAITEELDVEPTPNDR